MFAFKKHIPTGKYRSFELDYTDIKIGRKICGNINEIRDEGYRIGFMIKKEPTKESKAPFKWVFLKRKANTEKEAREYLNNNFNQIIKQFDFYLSD